MKRKTSTRANGQTEKFVIETDVPLPGSIPPLKSALTRLDIGHSFLIRQQQYPLAYYFARAAKIRITSEKQEDGRVRVWRIK